MNLQFWSIIVGKSKGRDLKQLIKATVKSRKKMNA